MGIEDLIRSAKRYGSTVKQTTYAGLLTTAMMSYNGPASASSQNMFEVEPAAYTLDAPHYVREHRSTYRFPTPDFYVPTHGLREHGASLQEFGPHLFGMTTPATGDFWIRDDLYGARRNETRLHEVLHNRYPHFPEQDIRSMVRSILGPEGAPMHHSSLR